MKYLFMDTETAGLPRDYNAPARDVNNWPRLVQVGYILTEREDALAGWEWIVRPEGFEIPEHVSRVHGITQEKAILEGHKLIAVLEMLKRAVNEADVIIGHNVSFDLGIVGAEFYREFGENFLETKSSVCTMRSSTDFCKIPNPHYGAGGWKWPKLTELYEKLFGVPLAQRHTALDDIQATAKCFFELKRLGVIKSFEKEKI